MGCTTLTKLSKSNIQAFWKLLRQNKSFHPRTVHRNLLSTVLTCHNKLSTSVGKHTLRAGCNGCLDASRKSGPFKMVPKDSPRQGKTFPSLFGVTNGPDGEREPAQSPPKSTFCKNCKKLKIAPCRIPITPRAHQPGVHLHIT